MNSPLVLKGGHGLLFSLVLWGVSRRAQRCVLYSSLTGTLREGLVEVPSIGYRGGHIAGAMAGMTSEEVGATMEVVYPSIRPCFYVGPGKI